jgi:hypothetical protein
VPKKQFIEQPESATAVYLFQGVHVTPPNERKLHVVASDLDGFGDEG